jgi:tetratricopeptide (TPR) repeat protein
VASPVRTKRTMTRRNLPAAILILAVLCGPLPGDASGAAEAVAAAPPAGAAEFSDLQQKPSKKSKESAEDQYEKGLIALRYGLTDEAIRYGNQGLALDPNHFNSHNLLGSAYFTKGDYARSAAAYEKALEIDPKISEVHRNLGLAYVETKETEKAETAFRTAVGLNGDPEAAFYLSRLLYEEGRYEEALEFILKTIQKNSSSATAYNLKGVILNQMGRHKEALGSFQAGLVLAPDDVGLLINLGIAHINTGEPAKARPVFEKVIPMIKDAVLRARVEEYLKDLDKSARG